MTRVEAQAKASVEIRMRSEGNSTPETPVFISGRAVSSVGAPGESRTEWLVVEWPRPERLTADFDYARSGKDLVRGQRKLLGIMKKAGPFFDTNLPPDN
jgi:hypothetical protein